ncbi:MAG: hypothetical protein ACXW2E_01210 [Nitrososphaeraceae archaeon]
MSTLSITLLILFVIIVGGFIFMNIKSYRQKLATAIVQTSSSNSNIFSTSSSVEIERSKFFPDRIYVGKTSTLDPSLRLLYPNSLFQFPTDKLIIDKFQYFDIDGNEFEEIVFEKTSNFDYIMLYDKNQKLFYFLNRLTSQAVANDEQPVFVEMDVLSLTDKDTQEIQEYTDMSGLIEASVSNKNGFINKRLIRVYEREIEDNDYEYCVCIMDNNNSVHYYIGFNISLLQLEEV